MNRSIILVALLILSVSQNMSDNKIEYPETKKIAFTDTIFGTRR
jgi:hypothetical protein